jgi:hypothetical protein
MDLIKVFYRNPWREWCGFMAPHEQAISLEMHKTRSDQGLSAARLIEPRNPILISGFRQA